MEQEPHNLFNEECFDDQDCQEEKLIDKWSQLTPEQRLSFTGLGIIIAANSVDVLTTGVGLSLTSAQEGNPLGAYLYETGGIEALIAAKAVAMLTIIKIIDYLRQSEDEDKLLSTEILIGNTLRIVNLLYCVVMVNNILQILDSMGHINI